MKHKRIIKKTAVTLLAAITLSQYTLEAQRLHKPQPTKSNTSSRASNLTKEVKRPSRARYEKEIANHVKPVDDFESKKLHDISKPHEMPNQDKPQGIIEPIYHPKPAKADAPYGILENLNPIDPIDPIDPVDPVAPRGDCVEFEDVPLGTTYTVGDHFTAWNTSGTYGFKVSAIDFQYASGAMTSSGHAHIGHDGYAGHMGHEVQVNNINLSFKPLGPAPSSISILFGEYGGNINVSVNGMQSNVANFMDLHGTVLGGATLEVAYGGLGNDKGQLLIHGVSIAQFTLGGQELWIDHICQEEVPVNPECELDLYTAHVDGPTHGGSPNPLATGWTYPSAENAQNLFISRIHSMGLKHQMITFDKPNGWSPVVGTGDLFAGAGAPYAGGTYTSPALGASGNPSSGTAKGMVEYSGADNKVLFTLHNNGHWGGPDEPGIGDMDANNDTDRGINTTSYGNHFLEVMPSEKHEGGMKMEFKRPVPAVGMYVMGLEKGKRQVELNILRADGIVETRTADLAVGPRDVGGIQFLGYVVSDLQQKDCWIKAVKFSETLEDGDPSRRDIFAMDDIIYPAREVNPPAGNPDPQNPDVAVLNDPAGKTVVDGTVVPVKDPHTNKKPQDDDKGDNKRHEKPGQSKPDTNKPEFPHGIKPTPMGSPLHAEGTEPTEPGHSPEKKDKHVDWTPTHDQLNELVLAAGLTDRESKSLTIEALKIKEISADAMESGKQWLKDGLTEQDVAVIEAMSTLTAALLERIGCNAQDATELGSVIAVSRLLLEQIGLSEQEASKVSIDAALIWK